MVSSTELLLSGKITIMMTSAYFRCLMLTWLMLTWLRRVFSSSKAIEIRNCLRKSYSSKFSCGADLGQQIFICLIGGSAYVWSYNSWLSYLGLTDTPKVYHSFSTLTLLNCFQRLLKLHSNRMHNSSVFAAVNFCSW